jgi:hypothetical protein
MIDSLPLASLGLITLVFSIPLSYLLIRLIKESELYSWQDDIEMSFLKKWSGNPEDELYAWLRVRMEYSGITDQGRGLRFIERKIKQLDPQKLSSDVYVDCYGSLIDHNSDKEILSLH